MNQYSSQLNSTIAGWYHAWLNDCTFMNSSFTCPLWWNKSSQWSHWMMIHSIESLSLHVNDYTSHDTLYSVTVMWSHCMSHCMSYSSAYFSNSWIQHSIEVRLIHVHVLVLMMSESWIHTQVVTESCQADILYSILYSAVLMIDILVTIIPMDRDIIRWWLP